MKLNYETVLDAKLGELGPLMEWCKRNCSDSWRVSVTEEAGDLAGIYKFYFQSEKDFINFLVWKK
jgi:hypothetical protein